MERIASFSVNHNRLIPGVYVSRRDCFADVVLTTFDIRFVRPNSGWVMGTAGCHTIEHLGATFLRNDARFGGRVVYFGPMGCRTGFYLVLQGGLAPDDIRDLLSDMCDYILHCTGEIPGATAAECGNYLDHDLAAAQQYTGRFVDEVLNDWGAHRTQYQQ